MTVHASKGLEFDYVFVAGMEESIFPHMNTMMDPTGVEEERRLAYVAITRARKHLCLTRASTRQLYGQTSSNPPSRFLSEIPVELTQTIGVGSAGFAGTGWDAVDHKIFGRGKVVKVDGDTLHIRFAKTGATKKLLKDYAPIVKIG